MGLRRPKYQFLYTSSPPHLGALLSNCSEEGYELNEGSFLVVRGDVYAISEMVVQDRHEASKRATRGDSYQYQVLNGLWPTLKDKIEMISAFSNWEICGNTLRVCENGDGYVILRKRSGDE